MISSEFFIFSTLITIGGFLGTDYARSKLYDPSFTHGFREATV